MTQARDCSRDDRDASPLLRPRPHGARDGLAGDRLDRDLGLRRGRSGRRGGRDGRRRLTSRDPPRDDGNDRRHRRGEHPATGFGRSFAWGAWGTFVHEFTSPRAANVFVPRSPRLGARGRIDASPRLARLLRDRRARRRGRARPRPRATSAVSVPCPRGTCGAPCPARRRSAGAPRVERHRRANIASSGARRGSASLGFGWGARIAASHSAGRRATEGRLARSTASIERTADREDVRRRAERARPPSAPAACAPASRRPRAARAPSRRAPRCRSR